MDLTAIETVAGQLVDMGWYGMDKWRKWIWNFFRTFKDQKKLASTSNFGPPWNLATLLRQVHHFPISFWALKLWHKIHFSHFCGRSSAWLGTSQCRRWAPSSSAAAICCRRRRRTRHRRCCGRWSPSARCARPSPSLVVDPLHLGTLRKSNVAT